MTTTAILTLGYVKFALTPKKAAEIMILLADAPQVGDSYDRDAERREPRRPGSYHYVKPDDDQSSVHVTLTNAPVEPCRREPLPEEE
jgi:hypothetical protein